MALKHVILLAIVAAINLTGINGHGTVLVPPQRSSAWREGFKVPSNTDDVSLRCGGKFLDLKNGKHVGKCGVCGDAYTLPKPRPNENGGLYGKGVIVRTYKSGETIDVTVNLSAAHKGYFEFSICDLKNNKNKETEKCFEKNKLKLANGEDKFTEIVGSKYYNISVVLPENVKCEQCVFRWHYRTGNNWGNCEDGSGRLGCGPQETFRTCSDIAIV